MEFKEGLIEGMSFESYRAVDACSSSLMKLLAYKCPLEYKHAIETPFPQSEDMKKGTAIHLAMEDYDKFLQQYVSIPKVDRRTKEGKAAYEKAMEGAAGKIVLDEEQYCDVLGMYKAITNHSVAMEILKDTKNEVSGFWIDSETEVKCKLRADVLADDYIVDFKSARSVDRWAKTCADRNYDFQAAWYLSGLTHITGNVVSRFIHIAVQNTAPYHIVVREFSPTYIEVAMIQVQKALKIYQVCSSASVWPGYPETIELMEPPYWALSERVQS